MKKILVIALFLVQIGLVGCSGGAKDPLNDEAYIKQSEEIGKQKREIFLRAEGDYTKMVDGDRKTYLSFFDNEEDARAFWDIMKNPPGGAPGGTK
ncbi:MAG: hypothetical protein JNJ45_06460 [Chthonomonas sp.]|nr:hypothetical protein [Chthonomonas sp.]